MKRIYNTKISRQGRWFKCNLREPSFYHKTEKTLGSLGSGLRYCNFDLDNLVDFVHLVYLVCLVDLVYPMRR